MAITGIGSNYNSYSNYVNTAEKATNTAVSENENKTGVLGELQKKYSNFSVTAGTFSQSQVSTSTKGFQGVMISSAYLEKAENDEKTATALDEMLSGVEDAYNWLKNAFKSEGLELVSCGYYIDENGNMGSWSVVEKKDSIFDGLAKQNKEAADRIKERKEKDKEEKKLKEKKLEEKKAEEEAKKEQPKKADKIMITASSVEDLLKKAREAFQETDGTVRKKDEQPSGANLDLKA